MTTSPASDQATDQLEAIHVYWRPGCPFCMSLDRALRDVEIPIERHNIWEDPEAAAFVRSVANGNETVPTVTVGNESLVNPSAKDVAAAVARVAPDRAAAMASVTAPGPLGRMLKKLSGGQGTN